VEAILKERHKAPAVVGRRFGAGRVLYCAFDATWRWRYKVADRYHQKYWNQVVSWLMEAPYAVKDDYVSLDVGAHTYEEGDTARLRVRLRDREGKPLLDASAEAIVYREGKKLATIALEPDSDRGGIYRGATAELEPGDYEVGVSVTGFSELEMKARTTFTVEPRKAEEYVDLTCDESLLGEMAEASGGAYLREEDAGSLVSLLTPLSEGKIVVEEMRLARSYWWFLPIILLLTLEWFIRKRAGML
jgi:hypothetical protein